MWAWYVLGGMVLGAGLGVVGCLWYIRRLFSRDMP
jgi:hypothetical protein